MVQMNEYKAIVLEGEDKEGALLATLLLDFIFLLPPSPLELS